MALPALAASEQEVKRIGRLYWYTLEFGVLREEGRLKVYGAGLLLVGVSSVASRPDRGRAVRSDALPGTALRRSELRGDVPRRDGVARAVATCSARSSRLPIHACRHWWAAISPASCAARDEVPQAARESGRHTRQR